MHPQDPATLDFRDQLEQHPAAPLRQGLGHRAEAGPVHPHAVAAKALHGLLLAQAHRAQLRLGEHGAGHQVVIHLAMAVAVEAVGEGPPLIHRHRRQIDPIGHIAHGIDMGHVGALIGIHRDAPTLLLHPGRLQVQTLQEGPATGGQEHAAAREHGAIGGA